MPATTRAHAERIVAYYRATSEESYLAHWAKGSLGFHFGLADENTASLAESIINTNVFLANRAAIGVGTRVLDAGCGVGGSSLWLAREREARVSGVNLSPEQVELARRLAREQNLEEEVEFFCMDMCSTDFPQPSFEVVWQLESLCYVEDLESYVRHVYDLLEQGGRFACIDLCRTASPDTARERIVCDGWSMASPMRRPEEIAEVLRRVGFSDVQTIDLTERARRSIEACRAMALNTLPMLKAERALLGIDNAVYQAHVEAARTMADGMLDGAMCLGHVLATRPARL